MKNSVLLLFMPLLLLGQAAAWRPLLLSPGVGSRCRSCVSPCLLAAVSSEGETGGNRRVGSEDASAIFAGIVLDHCRALEWRVDDKQEKALGKSWEGHRGMKGYRDRGRKTGRSSEIKCVCLSLSIMWPTMYF